jgi:hypothetical protein
MMVMNEKTYYCNKCFAPRGGSPWKLNLCPDCLEEATKKKEWREGYARVGKGKVKHLHLDARYEHQNIHAPIEEWPEGLRMTRCGKEVSGIWTPEEAMGRDWCDQCHAARDIRSRRMAKREATRRYDESTGHSSV